MHVFGFSTQPEPVQPPTKALKKLPPPTPHEPSPPPELVRSKFHTGLARVQEGWQITKQTGQSDAGYAMILEGLVIMLEDNRIDHPEAAELRVLIGDQMTQVEQLKERMDALASGPSTELGDGTGNAPEVSPQAPHIAKASALAAEPAPTTSPLPPSPDQLKRAATDPSPHTLAPVSPTDLGPSTGLGDGTGKSAIRILLDRVKAEEPAPSVPGSVPEQPAMEVDKPGSAVQKLIIDPVDPAAPTDVKSEADFGGDPDEVEPETLQEPWLRNLCVNHPRVATQTAQVMAHLIDRADLVTRVEKMSPDDALLEVKVAYCNYISQSKHPKTCFGICCLCFFW